MTSTGEVRKVKAISIDASTFQWQDMLRGNLIPMAAAKMARVLNGKL